MIIWLSLRAFGSASANRITNEKLHDKFLRYVDHKFCTVQSCNSYAQCFNWFEFNRNFGWLLFPYWMQQSIWMLKELQLGTHFWTLLTNKYSLGLMQIIHIDNNNADYELTHFRHNGITQNLHGKRPINCIKWTLFETNK